MVEILKKRKHYKVIQWLLMDLIYLISQDNQEENQL